jgi:phage shock protein A
MKLIKRFFKWFKSEGHSVIDKIEDPIKITEQAIRELKENYETALQSMAEVQANQIRAQRDKESITQSLKEWTSKYKQLVEVKAKPELITSAANRLKKLQNNFKIAQKNCAIQEKNVAAIGKTTNGLWDKINDHQNELQTLKTRHVTAQATLKIHKQLSGINPDGALSVLEDMRLKVDKEEALALSYFDMNEDQLANEVAEVLELENDPLLIKDGDKILKIAN